MIWYKVSLWSEDLSADDFASETDKFLVRANGRKVAKDAENHAWFPTTKQAHEWRVNKLRRRFELAMANLTRAEAEYNDAVELLEKHS